MLLAPTFHHLTKTCVVGIELLHAELATINHKLVEKHDRDNTLREKDCLTLDEASTHGKDATNGLSLHENAIISMVSSTQCAIQTAHVIGGAGGCVCV